MRLWVDDIMIAGDKFKKELAELCRVVDRETFTLLQDIPESDKQAEK